MNNVRPSVLTARTGETGRLRLRVAELAFRTCEKQQTQQHRHVASTEIAAHSQCTSSRLGIGQAGTDGTTQKQALSAC